MKLILLAAMSAFLLFSAQTSLAQVRVSALGASPAPSQNSAQNAGSANMQSRIITVSRGGEAYAKPDLGILIMTIQSSSAIADEAVAQNGQKATAVQMALAGLGFAAADYQISSVTFAQAGAGMPRMPGQSDIAAYQAIQYVYVFFQAADLGNVGRLTQRSAAVIEALRKAGAVPANMNGLPGNIFSPTAQGSLIIYTIKDPTQYEHEAMQVAIARARDAAQDIAVATGVKIAGLRNVQSGFLSGSNMTPRTGSSPLMNLKYRWYTTKIDELEISANATVEYDFN